MALLSDEEIGRGLGKLAGWERQGDTIVKHYLLQSFVGAIAFVQRVADRAEEMGHHPDITIHYNEVTLSLSTHSAGGITEKDLKAASSFDKVKE